MTCFIKYRSIVLSILDYLLSFFALSSSMNDNLFPSTHKCAYTHGNNFTFGIDCYVCLVLRIFVLIFIDCCVFCTNFVFVQTELANEKNRRENKRSRKK